MTIIQFQNLIKSTCRKSGATKVNAAWKRYYDDGRILTSYGKAFGISMKSTDELYAALNSKMRDASYTKIFFKTACLNADLDCGYHIDAKEVINRLVAKYPGRVIISDSLNFDPVYPLLIDSVSVKQSGNAAQLTLNVSGNKAGNARIVWGSLANVETKSINPTVDKSVTYEKVLSPGDYTICATVI